MNRLALSFSAVLPLLSLLGCGSSALVGENPGTGTNTLEIRAEVAAVETIPNASAPNDFNVEFIVVVTRGGQPVTDATVKITPGGGAPLSLVHQGAGQSGRYSASRVGYDSTYVLDVVTGGDNVLGARIVSPGIHTFTKPSSGEVVAPRQDLLVTWLSLEAADETSIDTKEMDQTAIPDSGTFIVNGVNLVGEEDKQKQGRIRLWRANRVGLTGGVGSSELKVSIRNRLEFLIDVEP